LLQRRTLTSQVIDYVLDLIKSDQVRPGQKLPTEKELTATLGVSRTCVREAMKSLESLRLIRIRPKVGSIVLEPSPTALINAEHFSTAVQQQQVDTLLEFRKIIEVGLASLAAEKGDENDMRAMEKALDEYKQELEAGQVRVPTDLSFHSALAAASKNPLAIVVWQMISAPLAEALHRAIQVPHVGEETFRDHLKIYQAIKARNPKRARAVMRAHLDTAERIWRIAKAGSDGAHGSDSSTSAIEPSTIPR
jgi:GntR family transcriptional repressor for pyruvate dehydrogenase complex